MAKRKTPDFDAVDLIFEIIKDEALKSYKDKPPVNEKGAHVTVSALTTSDKEIISKVPVNVNLFTPVTSNGMVNRTLLRNMANTIMTKVGEYSRPKESEYSSIEKSFSAFIPNPKNGFNGYNIRFDVILIK